jgi:hypothetical protein
MLSTSGSGASTVTVTVNFSDGTNQQFTGISIADWYNGTNFALQGLEELKNQERVLLQVMMFRRLKEELILDYIRTNL